MKKVVLWFIAFIFFLLVVFIFIPVPISSEDNCLITEGFVQSVSEAGEKDVVIRLKECHKTFYINRGLETGLDLDVLRTKLLHNHVTIKYPKYWTPLDPLSSTRHIAKLNYGEEVIFNEMK